MLGGWAYNDLTYASSDERTQALDAWRFEYSHRRRHQALGRQPLITRLNPSEPTANGAWTTASRIFAPGIVVQSLDVNDRGDALAFGSDFGGLYAAYKPAGGAWDLATPLAAITNGAIFAAGALDPQGNAVAVWQERTFATSFGNTLDRIQASRKPEGGSWAPALKISDTAPDTGSAVDVVVGPNGQATAVWEDRALGARAVVRAATGSSAGTWEPAQTISPGELDSSQAQLGIDAGGNVTALFQSRGASGPGLTDYNDQSITGVWAAERFATIGWQPPRKLAATGFSPSFSFATSSSGHALLTWYDQQRGQQEEPAPSVYALLRSDAGEWGVRERIGGPAEMDGRARPPGTAINAAGLAVVTWVFHGDRLASTNGSVSATGSNEKDLDSTRDPAKLSILRSEVRGGRLNAFGAITARATGRATVSYRSAGQTTRFTVPIANGRIRFAKRLPAAQRHLPTGIMTLTYPGNKTVLPDSVRLRETACRRRESPAQTEGLSNRQRRQVARIGIDRATRAWRRADRAQLPDRPRRPTLESPRRDQRWFLVHFQPAARGRPRWRAALDPVHRIRPASDPRRADLETCQAAQLTRRQAYGLPSEERMVPIVRGPAPRLPAHGELVKPP